MVAPFSYNLIPGPCQFPFTMLRSSSLPWQVHMNPHMNPQWFFFTILCSWLYPLSLKYQYVQDVLSQLAIRSYIDAFSFVVYISISSNFGFASQGHASVPCLYIACILGTLGNGMKTIPHYLHCKFVKNLLPWLYLPSLSYKVTLLSSIFQYKVFFCFWCVVQCHSHLFEH